MNKYPQIINYGKELYIGYFDKENKVIKNAMVVNLEEARLSIKEFLEAELLDETADITMGGVEYAVKELSQRRTVEFDNYKATLKQAERTALNKLIVKEARDNG